MESGFGVSTDAAIGEIDDLVRLQPAVKKVWAIKLGLAAVGALVAAFVFDVLRVFGFLPFGVLTGSVLISSVCVVAILPGLRFRFWRYALRDRELYLEHGILTRVRTIVPLIRIQHLDISQDVIEREFGVSRLIVHTAGTRSSDVVVPGLAEQEAERMREVVRRYVADESL